MAGSSRPPSTVSAAATLTVEGGAVEARAAKEALRQPGRKALANLLGKGAWIARDSKGLVCQPARGLMLPVAVPWRTAEDGDDHLWLEGADDPDHVAEQRIAGPLCPGVVDGLGVAEVVGPREELAGAIDPPRGQQLFGAQHAEAVAELGADEVLPALAPIEREIGGVRAFAPRQEGDQLRVLVVRVRADDQDALGVPETPQRVVECHHAARGWRRELRTARDSQDDRCQERKQDSTQGGRPSVKTPETNAAAGAPRCG